MKVFLKGLYSCALRRQKFNQYLNFLVANGHEIVENPNDADKTIVWTCAFRADVRDYSISEILRYENESTSDVIVAGCLPDIDPDLLKEHFSGDVIAWRGDSKQMENMFGSDKVKFDEVSPIFVEKNICEDVSKFKEENPDKDAIFHDQFLKLVTSEGCRFECSYCSERLAFPPFRSFSIDKIVEACSQMVKKTGKTEVVLLGDCLGDYGKDIGTDFPTLLRRLKSVHSDLRFALNNFNLVNFVEYYGDFKEHLNEGNFVHLNLPIQSASEKVLKLMVRPYSLADMDKVFELLKSSNFKEFDTHIIVGFPGEEEEDYEETIQYLLRISPKHVLVSGYMDLPGMDSARLSNKVDSQIIINRLHDAERRIKAAGIICNSDGSDLIKSRFKRLSSSN